MPISALDALDTLLRKRSFRRKPGAQRSGRGQPGRQDKGKGKFVKMDNIIEISSDDEDNDESDGRDLPDIDGGEFEPKNEIYVDVQELTGTPLIMQTTIMISSKMMNFLASVSSTRSKR